MLNCSTNTTSASLTLCARQASINIHGNHFADCFFNARSEICLVFEPLSLDVTGLEADPTLQYMPAGACDIKLVSRQCFSLLNDMDSMATDRLDWRRLVSCLESLRTASASS